jgi:hypothetical protein
MSGEVRMQMTAMDLHILKGSHATSSLLPYYGKLAQITISPTLASLPLSRSIDHAILRHKAILGRLFGSPCHTGSSAPR